MSYQRLILGLCLTAMALGCQSINIKTGPPTDEEATEESVERGRRVRVDWANRLRGATPVQQAGMLRELIDSTSARFIRYGLQVAEMWRDESQQRGREIPIEEIRRVVEASNRTEVPLLEAYEDVLEYGLNGVLETRFFDERTEELLLGFRDHYLEVYSTVFYPNGSREDFELQLHNLQTRTEELSRLLGEELRRFE